MAIISKKKEVFPLRAPLIGFLERHDRLTRIPVKYEDLTRYSSSIPLYDKDGADTLWETVFYPESESLQLYDSLKRIYALLKADGELSVVRHLSVDRVDLCAYGNTKPFRVRIVNNINDNFDYFYVKRADASRVYGLELEDLLSPNSVEYLVNEDTLIEEHIAGVPGDAFMNVYMKERELNRIRLAKEFVKFNERCFVRLLGDMHSSNFVVEILPDFDEVHYRLRAIDFDQQSHEGRRAVYMPQYFKQNNAIIALGFEVMTPQTVLQYQKEERTLIRHRARASQYMLKDLLGAMKEDVLSTPEKVASLREELHRFYKSPRFLRARNMGQILEMSVSRLFMTGAES